MNNKIIAILVITAAVLLTIGVVGKKKGWFGNGNIKKVAVSTAQNKTIEETVTASGKIYPQTEVKISSEVSGEITQLNVKEGDMVQKGDLLLVINPVIYESVVAQSSASVNQVRANETGAVASYNNAKALYDQALITYNRNKQLHDEKIIADADFDAATNALKNAKTAMETAREQMNASGFSVKSAQAQLKQATDNLGRTRIYAPMSGIISVCNVKLGERVVGTAQMAGTELIRIADLSNVEAQVDVNENDVLRVKLGDTADVEVDAYLNQKFKGVVTQVAYSSSAATSSIISTSTATNFTVKIKLLPASYEAVKSKVSGFPFRPGMSTTVDIHTNTKTNVLAVPIQSVTRKEKDELTDENNDAKKEAAKNANFDAIEKTTLVQIVWKYNDSDKKVYATAVKTGVQDASFIEITEGLKAGDKVVSAPFKMISKTIKNKDLVEVVPEKDLFEDAATNADSK